MTNIRDFKEVNKIEELGDKIVKFVKYHEEEKGKILKLAALADILLSIKEIFKSYDKRFSELEKFNFEHQEINETGGINKIKIILDDLGLKGKKAIK